MGLSLNGTIEATFAFLYRQQNCGSLHGMPIHDLHYEIGVLSCRIVEVSHIHQVVMAVHCHSR